MSETYSKNQYNKKIKRELDLLRFRQELERHGYKDTLRTKTAAKGATRQDKGEEMGSRGMSSKVRKDGDGD